MPPEVGGGSQAEATPFFRYPPELVGIRGLAAVYILFKHSFAMLPPLFFSQTLENNYGVNLFMIVSGFSIYRLLDKRKPDYGRFIVGRALRIFPVYLVGLAVSVLMLDYVKQTVGEVPSSPTNIALSALVRIAELHLPAHVATHVVLLQGLVPDSLLPRASYTIIGRAWSLSVEWQLYLIAPLVITWLGTFRRRTSQLCLAGLAAILFWSAPYLSGGFIGNHIGVLSIGFASYAFVKRFGENGRALWFGALALLTVTAICDARVLPPVMLWILSLCAATAGDHGSLLIVVSKFLRSRTLQYIGCISYSFYVFHTICVILCLDIIHRIGVPDVARYFVLPSTSLCFAILLADVAFRFVERPCHRLGTALTTPNDARSDACTSSLASRVAGWTLAIGSSRRQSPADSR